MSRRFSRIALVAVLVALWASPAVRANTLLTITLPDRHGEIPSKWLTYPGPMRADVLLPTGYNPRRAYPLIVLLPGFSNTYAILGPTMLKAQQVLAGLRAIVVAPDGETGWYADWYNRGAYGTPEWESYILDEALPQILARYKILPQRRYHALFGISMGGLGTAYLGGRLPGFFGSIGVLSGFVDLQIAPAIVSAGMDALTGVPPGSVVGPENGFYATAHNPTALVRNLQYTRVFVSAGDGTSTPADGPGAGVGNAEEAGVIRPMSDAYAAALKAAGINVTYHTHHGCHCWPDFQAELRDAIAWGPFKPMVEHPTDWINDTVATHGQLWDIGYRFASHPTKLVRFTRTSSRLLIGAAGTSVTLRTGGGCVVRVMTPTNVTIPPRICRSGRPHRRQRRPHATDAGASERPGGFTRWEKQITHVTAAGEPELAVGPSGTPLLVAFNSCGIAVSHDRGASFSVRASNPADPGPTPGDPYHYCSDPVAAIGPHGVLYTGAGYWDQALGAVDYYNMFVSRSGDGGLSWSKPVFATGDRDAPQQLLLGRNTGHTDRLFLAVDASTGTVYGSATDFPRLVRWVVVSRDGGSTFGPPRAIDSNRYPQAHGELVGDYIPAAANGMVAFAYAASAAPGRRCPCGIFETSRDGGVRWMRHPAPFDANWVAADPSHPGRFAIMSGQGATATPANPGYITVSATSNYGRTWTKPLLIGQPPLHPRIEPWIAYSPTGVLAVGYKTLYTGLISQQAFVVDALQDKVPGDYDYWTAVSFNNGRTFSRPLRVSTALSPPGNAGGNDDFSSVALDDRYLYAAWGDQRQSPTNSKPGPVAVYFARVPLSVYSARLSAGRGSARSSGRGS